MLIHDRFVFLHLPKTGGTFTASALRQEMPPGSLRRGAPGKLHPRWGDIPASARNRPVLMYVRNPWDWYVSWYHFVLTIRPVQRPIEEGVNDFATAIRKACSGLIDPDGPGSRGALGRGGDFYTARFLRFCDGNVDSELLTIGRFESLVDDLDRFLVAAGEPLPDGATERIRASKPLKTTEHRPYREYYDQELRDLFGASCKMLVERFDYSF